MIKNALSVMPTRPIVYIVPLVVIVVLTFYYGEIYAKCTANREFRASLNELLTSTGVPERFRLADATDFGWDRVRIVTEFKPDSSGDVCPLDWNWTSGERDALIASGLLTVLVFVHKGVIVNYLELRDDEVAFQGADSSLSPQSAVFSVRSNRENDGIVTLTLVDPE
jgi:hypothetical protein